MPFLDSASGPTDLRLYAIGDIHGRLDLLRRVHADIARDFVRRPVRHFRVIHVGDYIDRGPDSAGVLDHLAEYSRDGDSVCLAGNHDIAIRAFLAKPADNAGWLAQGGDATLASYGVDPAIAFKPRGLKRAAKALAEAMPKAHLRFLESLPFYERHVDFLFVHAGIRPGRALKKQKVADVTFIREPFLSDKRDHGAVVVHGHTTAPQAQIRRNRIGIDTKAWASGLLTCLVIDGPECAILTEHGPFPIQPPK